MHSDDLGEQNEPLSVTQKDICQSRETVLGTFVAGVDYHACAMHLCSTIIVYVLHSAMGGPSALKRLLLQKEAEEKKAARSVCGHLGSKKSISDSSKEMAGATAVESTMKCCNMTLLMTAQAISSRFGAQKPFTVCWC